MLFLVVEFKKEETQARQEKEEKEKKTQSKNSKIIYIRFDLNIQSHDTSLSEVAAQEYRSDATVNLQL